MALAAIGFRLAEGSLPVTLAVRALGHLPGDETLAVAGASLRWNRHAAGRPLVLELRDPVLRRKDGSVVGSARLAGAEASPGALMRGLLHRRLPHFLSVSVQVASLALRQGQDGRIGLDVARGEGARLGEQATAPKHGPGIPDRLKLRDVAVVLRAAGSGRIWQMRLDAAGEDLNGAAASGRAAMTVDLAGTRARIAATLAPGGVLRGDWQEFNPAALWPQTGALAALRPDLAISGEGSLRFDRAWRPIEAALSLRMGPGRIWIDGAASAVAGGDLRFALLPATRSARLEAGTLTLACGASLHASGGARFQAGRLEATLGADASGVDAANLAACWPARIAPDARRWVGANIHQGQVRAAHLDLGLSADLDGVRVNTLNARVTAQNLSVSWLAPVPPLLLPAATLSLTGPDAVLIQVPAGTEAPSDPAAPPLSVSNLTMRITGLAAATQTGSIAGDVSGDLRQAISLLSEKRLHLLADHPIGIAPPTGTTALHVTVALPLTARARASQIAVRVGGSIADLHIGQVVAGQDLDSGALTLTASNDGLHLAGRGILGAIPVGIDADLDFRAGPPGQVVARYQVQGTGQAAALAAAGMPGAGLAQGPVGVVAGLSERRDGSGLVEAAFDLTGAGLTLPVTGWQKPPGTPARIRAELGLLHDRLAGAGSIAASGQGLDLAARAQFDPAGGAEVSLDRLVLGASDASGTLRWPRAAGAPARLTLKGGVLDLSARFTPDPNRVTLGRRAATRQAHARRTRALAAKPAAGKPWIADVSFDRVDLGPGRTISRFSAHAEQNGTRLALARASGQCGTGTARLAMDAAPNGRDVSLNADDAGGLLAALGVSGSLRGGRIAIKAAYDDRISDAPLAGTARISRFRVVGATAAARLLQGMTLYGLVDVLRGPGLAIAEATVPFRFADGVLTLTDARASSSSLGFTAAGDVDLVANRADIKGTIVPGYFFNALLGKVPVLGKLFSLEKGGGVFAANYALSGSLDAPKIRINPLSALAPGFLRGIFGGQATARPAE